MYTMRIDRDGPCGCGRSATWGTCCFRDGRIRTPPTNVNPPGPDTGLRTRKCILAPTANCDRKLSGEHILAAAVLRSLTDSTITVLSPRSRRTHAIGSRALTTKRFCTRHNAAFGALDAEAGRLIRAIQQCNDDVVTAAPEGQTVYAFNGCDPERWMAKTMCALYYSKYSNVNPDTHSLPTNIHLALQHSLGPPYGLYVPTTHDDGGALPMEIARRATIGLVAIGDTVAGLNVSLGGLRLKLVLGGTEEDVADLAMTHSYRPAYVNFFHDDVVRSLAFTWFQESKVVIWLSRAGPDASLPTNAPSS